MSNLNDLVDPLRHHMDKLSLSHGRLISPQLAPWLDGQLYRQLFVPLDTRLYLGFIDPLTKQLQEDFRVLCKNDR